MVYQPKISETKYGSFGIFGDQDAVDLFWTKQKSGQSWIFFLGDGWMRWGESWSSAWWWLEPWNFEWLSHHIGNVILPTDELHHFSEGLGSTTNQLSLFVDGSNWKIHPDPDFFVSDASEKNLVWKQVLLAPNVPHDFCPRDVIDFRRSISVSPRGFDHIWTRHWTSISKSSNAPNERNPKPHPNGVCWNFLIVGICGTHRLATLYSSWAPGKKRREVAAWSWILSHFKGYIKLKPATTPNFNHWGVCSQSYYTWVSCWLKKTWGLPRGEGSGVIPNQMQQGRLPSSRTTCDVETPQGMSSCVALTRHDPQFRSSSTQSPSRIGHLELKKTCWIHWIRSCGWNNNRPPIWEWFLYHQAKNADDWGMVRLWNCFTHRLCIWGSAVVTGCHHFSHKTRVPGPSFGPRQPFCSAQRATTLWPGPGQGVGPGRFFEPRVTGGLH